MEAKNQTKQRQEKGQMQQLAPLAAQNLEQLTRPANPAVALQQIMAASSPAMEPSNILTLQRAVGNRTVRQMLAARTAVQRENGGEAQGANPGGGGPGSVQHASEQPYNVSGATLDNIVGQLNRFDGFAAETYVPIGLNGQVIPDRQPDDTYRVEVQWSVDGAIVRLPRWTDYDAACAAAQGEWDRFMSRARQHEQQAHVDASREFVAQLGQEDTVVTGATIPDLQRNLEAKQQELGQRLQAIHDACDHGASIDAFLHPDNGRCEET